MFLFLQLVDDDSDGREDRSRDDLWMTSNQFKAILEKQEVRESEAVCHGEDHEADLLNSSRQLFEAENEEDSTCSYLDQEAKIPFRKLKQVRYFFRIFCQLKFWFSNLLSKFFLT